MLHLFLNLQVLLAVAALLAFALRLAGRRLALGAMAELRAQYGLLALFALLLFAPTGGSGEAYRLPSLARVELAREKKGEAHSVPGAVLVVRGHAGTALPLDVGAWLALLGVLAGVALTAGDYARLGRELRSATVFRKVGRVRIAVSETAVSPYSYRGWRRAWVVLPPGFVSEPARARIAIAHELQHHRARDTSWSHAFALLRALAFFHPLRPLWASSVSEAQELACDEVLVRQKKKISAGDYSRCLIDAAELAVRGRSGRAYAAAPTLFSDRRLLVRRIETMYGNKMNNRMLAVGLGLFAGVTLAASAWASGHFVVDSRLSKQRMVQMAEVARRGTDFPVVVNERVYAQLNWFLGTEKGRAFVAASKAHLARLRPELDRAIETHGVPPELLAVGFIESGFENLPQSDHPAHSAGVWQFIPSTARNYGLVVDGKIDQRLDFDLETDAALRLLSDNHARFGDWLLSVMAYNWGERTLENAIQQAGTRDPWKLLETADLGDHDYLARFMAGVLILKNQASNH